MIKKNTLIFILLLFCLPSFAQTYDQKFGKVSMAEMEMKVCPIDSSTEAVVIFDKGETSFEYNTTDRKFQLRIARHVRLKILSKDGLDWANVNLNLYHENDLSEKLNSFKGYTYNLLSGKIQKDKVEKSAIFEDTKDGNRSTIKIAFPKVIEGSVLEYSYEIISDYVYNLQPWSFQSSIPVLYSEYFVGIPEYFNYNTHISGYENVSVVDEVNVRSITFNTATRENAKGLGEEHVNYDQDIVKYSEKAKKFIAINLPGMKDEIYVDNINNYLSKVDFELSYVKFPGEMQKNYTSTWESINDKLLDDTNFGKQLDNGNYLEEPLLRFITGVDKPEEKITKTIEFIRSKIKWNDEYKLFPEEGIKSAYKEGVGNSAEINLNLVVALRKAGFDAYPIVLSTRSHGLINEWQKTITGFNHVIAGVKLNDKEYFYDATSPFCLYGLLPTESINGQGRIIDQKKSCWIDLNPKTISRKLVFATFKIDEKSIITGKVETLYKDYFALNLAEITKGDDSLTHIKERLSKSFNNATIDSVRIKFGEKGDPNAKEYFKVTMESASEVDANILYVSPMAGLGLEKNPFVKVERKFPVNYTFARDESIIVKYKIPENFKVDEVPSNITFSMPEGKAKFSITYQVIGNELSVISKINIPIISYSSADYPLLRSFIDEVIKKQNEKVVLKRI